LLQLKAALPIACLACATLLSASPLQWNAGNPLTTPCSNMAVAVDSSGGLVFLLGGNVPANPLTGLQAGNLYPLGWAYLAVPLDTTRVGAGAAMDPSTPGQELVYGGSEAGTAISSAGSGGLTDVNNSFNNVANMSVARAYLGYATDAGNAYAIGGMDDQGNILSSVEYFNANGRWVSVKAMPTARWAFPAVDDGAGHIYVFGGGTTSSAASVSNTVYVYTVATNTWATVASMPAATRESAAALGPDGNIYVVGGSSGAGALNTVQIFNLASQSWSLGVSLPAAVRSASAVVDAGGHLNVLGGIDATGKLVSTTWTTQVLNQPDSAPVFTSLPSLVGSSLVPYNYQPAASGNPQPTYSLVSGPAGMSYNPKSNLLTWTPSATQTGRFTVVVQAINRAGAIEQNFVINVQGPAPTPPTGVTVSGITDVSATLQWKASTVPGGAPITYRISQVVCHSGRGGGCGTVIYADNISGTTAAISGLKPGLGYAPTVSAIANAHVVAGGSVSFVTTSVPMPQNLVISAVTQTTATLSWSIPPHTSAASFEIINMSVKVLAKVPGNLRSYTVTGLTPNTYQGLYMAALDAYGYSSGASPTIYFQTLSPPVLSLTNGRVVGVIGQSLMVLPSATASAGVPLNVISYSLPAPGYTLSSGPKAMAVNAKTGAVTWSPVTGAPGSYTAVVKATNSQGSATIKIAYWVYAAGTDVLAPTQIAAAPTLASHTATSATIAWTPATDNVGVVGYNIYVTTTLSANGQPNFTTVYAKSPGTGTKFTISGLTTGVAQYIGVAAYDKAGNVAAISPGLMVIP